MSEDEAQATESCEAEERCFCMGAGPELFSIFKKLGPDSARQHFRNARVEMLKGMRVLIDKRIEDLSKPAETKGTRLTVE
jgi:hypothetical protein